MPCIPYHRHGMPRIRTLVTDRRTGMLRSTRTRVADRRTGMLRSTRTPVEARPADMPRSTRTLPEDRLVGFQGRVRRAVSRTVQRLCATVLVAAVPVAASACRPGERDELLDRASKRL